MLSRCPNIFSKALSMFRREEDGSLIVFSLFVFMAMIIFGGVAVDLMMYENQRTHIQNATDRAVLAAADLDQTVDADLVVQDYLAKVGVAIDSDDVQVEEVTLGGETIGRKVSVQVDARYNTSLMHMVDVPYLEFSARSKAEEAVNDIEVSLVLDVSGSMRSNSKLQNMQSAAKDFVDKILANSEDNRVSLSLVPYSTQVSAGPELLAQMNTRFSHDRSYCVNFDAQDFRRTSINHNVALDQTAHFDPWKSYRSRSWHNSEADTRMPEYLVCRDEAFFETTPWSNNALALKDQIDDFTASGNTSIDIAMKWGSALLDPSMSPQLNALIANSDVNTAFANRPHPFDHDDALKFIVVMTDGINTDQYYLKDQYKTGGSGIYKIPDGNGNDEYFRELSGGNWWNILEHQVVGNPIPTSGPRAGPDYELSWVDMWAEMSMSWRAYHAYYRERYRSQDYWNALRTPRDVVAAADKDTRMNDICSAAKDKGIIVFAVGFEVTDHSANVMRNCASTPSHFYRVEGLDIEFAFAQIANQINQLKLTQ